MKEVAESSQVIEKMERETGFEPATSSLGSWHSTTELLPRSCVLPCRQIAPASLPIRESTSRHHHHNIMIAPMAALFTGAASDVHLVL